MASNIVSNRTSFVQDRKDGIENWYAKSKEWIHRIETRWSNFDGLKTRKYRSKRFMGNEDQLLEFERKRIF